jgi:hypothetical protein
VSRLHGIFGCEKRPSYADTKINDTKPFNPKLLRYDVFRPPGTVANINDFNVNADPSSEQACRGRRSLLPLRRRPWELSWRKTIVTVSAAASWWAVKSKPNGIFNAFTFCLLKAA